MTLVIFILSTVAAQAQFVGDIFATNPSQEADTGQSVTISYEVFTGTTPFGATQFKVFFDSTELEFLSASPNVSFMSNGGSYADNPRGGELELMVANGTSFDEPAGTVKLFDLEFRVLADVGTITTVSASNIGVIGTDNQDITGLAFSAEIVVQSPSTKTKFSRPISNETIVLKTGSDLERRAEKLRRPGYPVDIVIGAGQKQSFMLLAED